MKYVILILACLLLPLSLSCEPGDPWVDVVYMTELDISDALVVGGDDINAQIQGAQVTHNTDQGVNNATKTTLVFNTESWDTDSIHDNVTNNSRLTCKTAGIYAITCSVQMEADVDGDRIMYILVNGIDICMENSPPEQELYTHIMHIDTIWELDVDDYVQIAVYQNAGQVIDIYADTFSPFFTMQRIGDAT